MSIDKLLSNFRAFIKELYSETPVLLHRPVFQGNEKRYLSECIDSNFVSSVGPRVTEFEKKVAAFVGAKYAVATVNGTAALHVALKLAGVNPNEEVITQALTFVATCNAVIYMGAHPVFVDVERSTLGMSAEALRNFLEKFVQVKKGGVFNKKTGRRIAACVPMHTFGHPCEIAAIAAVCNKYQIPLIEDAAESLGSYYKKRHTGTFGLMGTLSFNGNKIITTGGGGMIVTNNKQLALQAKHITTTAKIAHPYKYIHDEVGYNYRMPNLNAALGCAQMEKLDYFLCRKRALAKKYLSFFSKEGVDFVVEPDGSRSNYWLNTVIFDSHAQQQQFLKETNDRGIMTRPVWKLMNELKMFKKCQHDDLINTRWLEKKAVNIPSSVPFKKAV